MNDFDMPFLRGNLFSASVLLDSFVWLSKTFLVFIDRLYGYSLEFAATVCCVNICYLGLRCELRSVSLRIVIRRIC